MLEDRNRCGIKWVYLVAALALLAAGVWFLAGVRGDGGPRPIQFGAGPGLGQVKVTTGACGADGSASGNTTADEMVRGRVVAVYLDYAATLTTTADITLAPAGTPTENVLAKANSATDAWYYPRRAVHSSAGAAIEYANGYPIYEPFWVDDYLKLSVAQGTALTPCVTAYVFWAR